MDFPKSSVFFMEEDSAIAAGSKPLMLEAVLSCPILKWMSSQLLADGVQRFFVVCSPRFAEEARACFPQDADVVIWTADPLTTVGAEAYMTFVDGKLAWQNT